MSDGVRIGRKYRSLFRPPKVRYKIISGGRGSAKSFSVSAALLRRTYDDKYNITWMSELFEERGIDRVGDKLTEWLPESVRILSGELDSGTVQLDDRIYEIRRKPDAPIMYFRDVTDIQNYKNKYLTSRLVIGMSSFDNYEESVQYADETEASLPSSRLSRPQR